MNPRFNNCLDRKQIFKDSSAKGFVFKEIEAADNDLIRARSSLEAEDFKWATVQSYYAGFHAARALLFSRGFRERSHYCLIQAIRFLFVDEGKLDARLLNHFGKIKALREKADYDLEFSLAGAEESLRVAEDFQKRAKELIFPVPP